MTRIKQTQMISQVHKWRRFQDIINYGELGNASISSAEKHSTNVFNTVDLQKNVGMTAILQSEPDDHFRESSSRTDRSLSPAWMGLQSMYAVELSCHVALPTGSVCSRKISVGRRRCQRELSRSARSSSRKGSKPQERKPLKALTSNSQGNNREIYTKVFALLYMRIFFAYIPTCVIIKST